MTSGVGWVAFAKVMSGNAGELAQKVGESLTNPWLALSHNFEDQIFANFPNLKQVHFHVTLVIYVLKYFPNYTEKSGGWSVAFFFEKMLPFLPKWSHCFPNNSVIIMFEKKNGAPDQSGTICLRRLHCGHENDSNVEPFCVHFFLLV